MDIYCLCMKVAVIYKNPKYLGYVQNLIALYEIYLRNLLALSLGKSKINQFMALPSRDFYRLDHCVSHYNSYLKIPRSS